jgi:metal iron transporter
MRKDWGLLTGARHRRDQDRDAVRMANNWFVTSFGVVVWLIIAVMNAANLVLLGKGE